MTTFPIPKLTKSTKKSVKKLVEKAKERLPYTLEELLQACEDIRDGKSDVMNFVKAFYTLGLEVQLLKATVLALRKEIKRIKLVS